MGIAKEKKGKLIQDFQLHKNDRGSSEVQVALLTERINMLTDHARTHSKDKHSKHGLLRMVERRKRLLTYLMRTNRQQYAELIKRLEIRK